MIDGDRLGAFVTSVKKGSIADRIGHIRKGNAFDGHFLG